MAYSKSPISILQEFFQINRKPLPYYSVSKYVNINGNFEAIIIADDKYETGLGKSIKEAKHNAALEMIKKMGIRINSGENNIEKMVTGINSGENNVEKCLLPKSNNYECTEKNYIGLLNEYCSQNCCEYPQYSYQFDGNHYNVTCSLRDNIYVGKHPIKKMAKHAAAHLMLDYLKSNNEILENKHKIELSGNEKNIEEIIKSYEKLKASSAKSIPLNLGKTSPLTYSKEKKNVEKIQFSIEDIKMKEEIPDSKDSECALRKMGVKNYKISLFATDSIDDFPFAIFKTVEVTGFPQFVLIEGGMLYDEAKRLLLAKAVQYCRLFFEKND